jgi:cytoskeletal protein CcmA (bactofilin family)
MADRGFTVFKRRKPDEPGLAARPGPDQSGLGEARPAAGDTGLGVPAFRPSIAKESPAMARPPLTTAPAQPTTITPPLPSSPAAPGGMPRPGMPPARVPGREPGERRMLVVGRGISVQGTVQDAERLVVEGTVEATMIRAAELSVAPGGMFKGEIEVEDAEIAGTIDGTLTAKGNLTIRATGKVLGTARCHRLQVEVGGQITGRMEMITEGVTPAAAPMPATSPVV